MRIAGRSIAAAVSCGRRPYPARSVWVCWPKKSSPLFADLTEDQVREVVPPDGLVDVKVCAFDADWSGSS